MSPLRQVLADYLAVRRALGYKLKRTETLLAQFLTYLEDRGEKRVSTETALAWATLPSAHPRYLSAAPELLTLAADRLEGHLGGDS